MLLFLYWEYIYQRSVLKKEYCKYLYINYTVHIEKHGPATYKKMKAD